MIILWLLAGAVAAITVAVGVYILCQGNEGFTVLAGQRGPLCRTADGAGSFSLVLPFANQGRQDGFVMDAFARVLLPEEQFALGRVSARLERAAARRADGYMEAFIAYAGKQGDFILTLEFTPLAGHTVDELLAGMVDVTVDIYYSVLGRTCPRLGKTPLTILLEEFGAAEDKAI